MGEIRGLHCCERPRAPRVAGEGKDKQHPSLPLGNSNTMKFSRQEYWSGLPCSSPEDLPHPGIELQADSLPSEPPGKPLDGVSRDELQHKAMGWLR